MHTFRRCTLLAILAILLLTPSHVTAAGPLPAAAALRAAQVEMSQDPRWSSPFLWAGFVLQGEWR